MSIDGVHCSIPEPRHDTLSKDPAYFSHKSNGPAVNYELGIAIHESRLVSINGPFKASTHDLTAYRSALKAKIPNGKKIIADGVYARKGTEPELSTPNTHDPPDLREFKRRARARHESFNRRIKTFQVMAVTFRHGLKNHQLCFEAVCVILQYAMEHGHPLFEV